MAWLSAKHDDNFKTFHLQIVFFIIILALLVRYNCCLYGYMQFLCCIIILRPRHCISSAGLLIDNVDIIIN